ncbi:MAG: hypothetical protein QOK47_955 [Actinomycetota bacterium]|nr:hypothetical protein [Actinomycetota bacterium]
MSFEADERGAKKRDYWFTVVLTDPVAVPISKFLAKRRWLTPNQVTIVALVLGLLVGVCFAFDTRWGLIAGGIAFYLAFVFDCVDGKLARATGITSDKGQALDALADGGRRASASLGLLIHLSRTGPIAAFGPTLRVDLVRVGSDFVVPRPFLLGCVYVVLAYYFLEISGADKGDPGGGLGGRWSQALAKRRLLPNPGMPDVQAIVFIFGPISGFVVPALWVGIAMVTLAILMTVRRRLRVPS